MRLVVDRGAEAEEAHGAGHDGDHHERQAELGLVDALVLPRQVDADPVVERARDHLAEDGHDEGREADEPRFADAEAVRRPDEDDTIDDGEYNDPRNGSA